MINLIPATLDEFDSVVAFYDDVMERTPNVYQYALWQTGKHPTADGIRAYIKEGSLYLYKEDGKIVGAMAFPMYQGEDYHPVEWARPLKDDEVAVLHIFAVSPDMQGKGIGAQMVKAAIELAREKGRDTVRLDTLATNLPAQHLYTSLGFQFRGQQHRLAENTIWTDFYYYEYNG